MRHPLQSPIKNSIIHYVTCDETQKGWIEQTILIFAGLNIRIGTDGSYPILTLRLCPKTTHMVEEILLCLLIIVKSQCD